MIQPTYWIRRKSKREKVRLMINTTQRATLPFVIIISVRKYSDQLAERLTDTHRKK
jgi:hypothetical protein